MDGRKPYRPPAPLDGLTALGFPLLSRWITQLRKLPGVAPDRVARCTPAGAAVSATDAPPLPMRAVPKKPTIRDIMRKDRLRMTPAAKKVLEQASKPNRRRLYVTAQQVLAQILTLQPPDPAAVLLDALGVDRAAARQHLDVGRAAA